MITSKSKWEYDVIEMDNECHLDEINNILDDKGSASWELISVVFDNKADVLIYYFKREIVQGREL